jgi:hypothetical protein
MSEDVVKRARRPRGSPLVVLDNGYTQRMGQADAHI